MQIGTTQLPAQQQPAHMTPQLWIGFGFLVALVAFLIISYFVELKQNSTRRAILQFLTSLTSGFAGGFLSGSSIFDASWTSPTSRIALSGTAGFAIFFAIWFSYQKLFPPPGITAEDSLSLDIPEGWSFKDVVNTLAGKDKSAVDYQGFTPEELNSKLKSQTLVGKSYLELMQAARLLSVSGAARPFTAEKVGNTYVLKVS
jgi:ABC-type transport system involved in multi-copper enzyme maturation permease subunit